MKTEFILTIILSSSLLSAFITGIITFIIHNQNFKKDYFKELLKKRLSAYESVENIYSILNVVGKDDDNRKYHFCLKSSDSVANLLLLLSTALKQSAWIKQDTINYLVIVNSLINEIYRKSESTPFKTQEYLEFIKSEYEIVSSLKDDLGKSMISDYSSLYKVNLKEVIAEKSNRKYQIAYQLDSKSGKYKLVKF
jgi:hypothetical protein